MVASLPGGQQSLPSEGVGMTMFIIGFFAGLALWALVTA